MNEIIKRVSVDGVEYDIVANGVTKTTYAELKTLRDGAQLVAGQWYRITDYEFTTKESNTKSAGHVFDVLVLAVDERTLNHNAFAALHEGDEYFAGVAIDAWQLLYDLDNDTAKYVWADEANGKGVIYRMVDEKRNDCPYDFKNALFYNTKYISGAGTMSDKYYYTFSYVVGGKLYDGTVEAQVKVCYGNSMGEYRVSGKLTLNKNVWRNSSFTSGCFSNTFGISCDSNTFGYDCSSNTFGNSFHSNTFGNSCHSNTFGYGCYSNTLGSDCSYNTLGNDCSSNTLGNSCHYNTFGNNCFSNIFRSSCSSNIFRSGCHDNTLGISCSYNTLGNYCSSNTLGNYCYYNTLGNNCNLNRLGDNIQYRKLDNDKTSITFNDEYYDDGSGQLVPVKHPDLSTQPSILPYKFMGNYVYEQLIPVESVSSVSLAVDSPVFISATAMGEGVCAPAIVSAYSEGVLSVSSEVEAGWYKVVYTSLPEDSSYYGDYTY